MASLEDQLVQVLANTQVVEEGARKQAEIDLKQASTNPAYPVSLANIASHSSVAPAIRQQALLILRTFIDKHWSERDSDGIPQNPIGDDAKAQLRSILLELALGSGDQRLVKTSACYAVSKIASFDFPEQWPDLLPNLINICPNGTDIQLHGALKILSDIVDESLSEEQFFNMARSIITAIYDVALSEDRKPILRALAVSVFRGCFGLMEIVKEDHMTEVKTFAETALKGWLPFFEHVMTSRLPESSTGNLAQQPDEWNGPITLKLQVVKTLIKIKGVFPQLLLPQSTAFFRHTWDELSHIQPSYQAQYIDSDDQGRLEDSDNLPYTLDFLVLEELDFFNQCLRATPIQKELEAKIKERGAIHATPWVCDLMRLVIAYSHITTEEEGLWDIDRSLYLAEETSVSANYTPRTACGDLLIKLGEWLGVQALEGLFAVTKGLFDDQGVQWKSQEAALFLFNMLVSDFQDCDKPVGNDIAMAYLDLVSYALSKDDQPLLKARGYLVAGVLAQGYPPAATLLDRTLEAISKEESELVQVACIKAIEGFINSGAVPVEMQLPIINCLSTWLGTQDMTEIEDADDLLVTLTETLRSAINMNYRVAISPDIQALDLLFVLAKHGAQNFQVEMIVVETFETIVRTMRDPTSFSSLCAKVLPILMKAFDVADVTSDHPLITMAADILVVLCEFASEPLPEGFVAATMPKLTQLLMANNEGEVLRPAAESAKYMLMYDHHQVFAWTDSNGRSGLEVCLHIIDRLLGPGIEDTAASEVGGLAVELVEKAGQERLGPFMAKLLEAVAGRLATAEAAPFIQSLILVFARLSLVGVQDVVEFLSQIQVNGSSGLEVVLGKWLENSVNFAGYDEIRQNIIALSKLYSLNDPRVVQTQVKGDLIVPQSDRIITRSQAKKHPDQYTIIPAPLKILKVLIEELLSASGQGQAASMAASAAAQFADEDDEDDGWEDEPDQVDFIQKGDLMNYLEGSGMRRKDDETQQYLSEFFLKAARENIADFQNWYESFTEEEKGKLNELAIQQQQQQQQQQQG
ncbi:hypothetical protein MKZ38_003173 [Zalerion maritima]|uniref:Importin N-terminal domain-containing protein n=1 Tax=Zalerion maritima TaxID=339359 RepID=A0AAD5WVK9_9PEZI|nr:hypothetical protein MKZ38_003173 [Zalerion maritima]